MPLPGAPAMGQSAFGQTVTRTGTAINPANASASFLLTAAGMARSAPTSGTFSDEFQWLTGASGTYWVRATVNSGSLTTGSTSIQTLDADRAWTRTRTVNVDGTDTVVFTVEIATDSAMAQIIATFQVTLNATVLS